MNRLFRARRAPASYVAVRPQMQQVQACVVQVSIESFFYDRNDLIGVIDLVV